MTNRCIAVLPSDDDGVTVRHRTVDEKIGILKIGDRLKALGQNRDVLNSIIRKIRILLAYLSNLVHVFDCRILSAVIAASFAKASYAYSL